jgi:hypothetical protein
MKQCLKIEGIFLENVYWYKNENTLSERISTHCVWYAALSEWIFLTKVMKKVIVMVLDMPIILTKHFLNTAVKEIKYRGTLSFEKNRYRLIILRKSLLFTLLSKNLTAFSTHQYFLVEFSFKFFDKRVNKRNFLNSINLYCPSFCIYSKVLVWCPLFAC